MPGTPGVRSSPEKWHGLPSVLRRPGRVVSDEGDAAGEAPTAEGFPLHKVRGLNLVGRRRHWD